MANSHKLPNIITGIFVSLFLLSSTTVIHAQIGNVQPILQAKEDATILVQEYLTPLSSGLGADINSGWNSSAGARHPLGFSIQLRGAVATIPTADQSFNINNQDLSIVQLDNDGANTGDGTTPTISGDDEVGPLMEIEETFDPPNMPEQTVDLAEFNMPPGLNLSYVPAPMIQASVGLPKAIEITGRIIPETPIQLPVFGEKDYGDFKMFGVGLKHEINSYIPGGDMLPLTFSFMGGFNQIDISSDLNLPPDPEAVEDPDYDGNYDDQRISANINTFTVNLLAGKDLPIVSVYGGVGYETSTMDVGITGHYPLVRRNPDFPQNSSQPKQIETVEDPVSFSQDGANNFHALVGGSVSLLFFDLMVEATLAKYPVVNAGIGFGF